MKVKSESQVAQSCPTPSNLMDCSPPGSSIHGIFQARVPEWVAIAFSEGHVASREQSQNSNPSPNSDIIYYYLVKAKEVVRTTQENRNNRFSAYKSTALTR